MTAYDMLMLKKKRVQLVFMVELLTPLVFTLLFFDTLLGCIALGVVWEAVNLTLFFISRKMRRLENAES